MLKKTKYHLEGIEEFLRDANSKDLDKLKEELSEIILENDGCLGWINFLSKQQREKIRNYDLCGLKPAELYGEIVKFEKEKLNKIKI